MCNFARRGLVAPLNTVLHYDERSLGGLLPGCLMVAVDLRSTYRAKPSLVASVRLAEPHPPPTKKTKKQTCNRSFASRCCCAAVPKGVRRSLNTKIEAARGTYRNRQCRMNQEQTEQSPRAIDRPLNEFQFGKTNVANGLTPGRLKTCWTDASLRSMS